MGKVLVKDVSKALVLAVLQPIWTSKTATASKVQRRIASVLDWAIASGYRDGPNPGAWRGNLDKLLPAPGKVKKTEHFAALPVGEIGAFMERLRKQEGMGAKALEFRLCLEVV